MKSPREILLDRHHEASPRLDEIRRQVIATELAKSESTWVEALRDWLSFGRVAWLSFASAWVVIIGLNVAANVDGGSTERLSTHADAAEVVEGVQRYQTQLAILLDEGEPPEQIEPSDTAGPRSDATRPRRNAQLQNHIYA